MALDTQSFPLKTNWLVSAFSIIPATGDVFTKHSLDVGRKAFLAGKNQLAAIKNWLTCGEVIDTSRGTAVLTDLGRLMSAQDPQANHPLTWWLLHLHLSASKNAFPYSTFFTTFDVDGNWVTLEEVVKRIFKIAEENGETLALGTVETYFSGIETAYRPGQMFYGLGLLERRDMIIDDASRRALRRKAILAPDAIVVYACLLFHRNHYPNQATVETKHLLKRGLSKALGMKDKDLRESLSRIHHDPIYSSIIQYRAQVNLDSIQFLKHGELVMKSIRQAAYRLGNITWS